VHASCSCPCTHVFPRPTGAGPQVHGPQVHGLLVQCCNPTQGPLLSQKVANPCLAQPCSCKPTFCPHLQTLAESLDAAVRPEDPYFNKLVRILSTRCMTQALYFCSGDHGAWLHNAGAAVLHRRPRHAAAVATCPGRGCRMCFGSAFTLLWLSGIGWKRTAHGASCFISYESYAWAKLVCSYHVPAKR